MNRPFTAGESVCMVAAWFSLDSVLLSEVVGTMCSVAMKISPLQAENDILLTVCPWFRV